MSSTDNRQRMQTILAAMGQGNLQPLFDAMSDEMTWQWMGTGQWSHTFEGKDAVVSGLFGAVAETLSPGFTVVVHRILADGDFVIVEHSGRNTTPDGRPYNNNYCWVCRFAAGSLVEIHEYMDTRLVSETFGEDHKA